MTSSSRTTAAARLSATVAPVTVIALVSSTGSSCLSSALRAAGVLELLDRVLAVRAHRAEDRDVVAELVEEPVDVEVEPDSIAAACRCLMQLIEPLTRAPRPRRCGRRPRS
jgi:hypothetical protein